jgi:hypothetical protein
MIANIEKKTPSRMTVAQWVETVMEEHFCTINYK